MIARTLSTSEKRAALHRVAGKLAEFCQSIYPLLVAHADDSGRQQGDPFTVKHAVDPTSPRGLPDFERALTALHNVGLIHWYEVDGRKYLEIHDFAIHQPGLKNRDNSKIPAIPEMPGNAVGCREMPLEEKGREEKGTEGKGTGASATTPPLTTVPQEPSTSDVHPEDVVRIWNETIVGTKLPPCRGLSENRKKHIRARVKDHGLPVVCAVMARVAKSAFCNGSNDRGWMMSFDWLMESADHFLRVLEGKYDDRRKGSSTTGGPPDAEETRRRYIQT